MTARWLDRFRRPSAPPARLRPEEARARAAEVADTGPFADPDDGHLDMTVTSMDRRDGRLVWIVGSATKGSGLTVKIDDATGTVVDLRSRGVR